MSSLSPEKSGASQVESSIMGTCHNRDKLSRKKEGENKSHVCVYIYILIYIGVPKNSPILDDLGVPPF